MPSLVKLNFTRLTPEPSPTRTKRSRLYSLVSPITSVMPLFKSRQDEFTNNGNAQQADASPTRKGSIFSSRNRSPPASSPTSQRSSGGGLFSRHRSSSSSSSDSDRRSRNGGGFMGIGRNNGDPTISAARQKVLDAENAEKQADRALIQARQAVRDAKEHVNILEREAKEDARRAKAKQAEAKVVSKSARGLGRHG